MKQLIVFLIFSLLSITLSASENDFSDFSSSSDSSDSEDSWSRRTPLMEACQRGSTKLVRELLAAYVDLEAVSEIGATALFYAMYAGKNETHLVKLLLEHGANPNHLMRDSLKGCDESLKYLTPLMVACHKAKPAIVTLLLQYNAKIDVKNYSNDTALHFACKSSPEGIDKIISEELHKIYIADIVKVVLAADANPNSSDNNGTTPLMYACHFNNSKVVALLLEHGAVPALYNNQGNSALHYACNVKNSEALDIVKLLIEE